MQHGAVSRMAIAIFGLWVFPVVLVHAQITTNFSGVPKVVRDVLEHTRPLQHLRGDRLPFLILPISGALRGIEDGMAARVLEQLSRRGIGYSVPWSPSEGDASAAEGIRMAKLVRNAGLPIVVDATACMDGFFDGSAETLHVDDHRQTFWDASLGSGRKMGCPLALESRIERQRERVEFFLRAYARADLVPDLVFADWEIDGPLEWNETWAHSKRCERCRAGIPGIESFRPFQRKIRELRSVLQREVLARPVLARNPKAWVGNYAVYPHDGHRYWYDYFESERLADGIPFVADQKARYREWVHEFEGCGYTLAMPVIYTWYPIFGWYDFGITDYRWFYNGLKEASSAGRHTRADVPLLPFVHRSTTAPPPKPAPEVREFSPAFYQELLWHLLLRGHDGLFLWCLPDELGEEARLAHAVYAESLRFREFLDRGQPVAFEVPGSPEPVVSALVLGERALVRRTDFIASTRSRPVRIEIGGGFLDVEAGPAECRIMPLRGSR